MGGFVSDDEHMLNYVIISSPNYSKTERSFWDLEFATCFHRSKSTIGTGTGHDFFLQIDQIGL